MEQRKLMVVTASTGSRFNRTKGADKGRAIPAMPYTAEEVIDDINACHQLGSRYFHVHSITDDGQHKADQEWYAEVARQTKAALPDARLSFATSRAGPVADQIEEKFEELKAAREQKKGKETDAQLMLEAEKVRMVAVLQEDPNLLPDACTTATGADIRMKKAVVEHYKSGNTTEATEEDTILVSTYQDPRGPELVRDSYIAVTELATAKNVVHEVEITSNGADGIGSFEILEQMARDGHVGSPLSVVVLLGFSENLPLDKATMDEAVERASRLIEQTGGRGFITVGSVIQPHSTEEHNMQLRNAVMDWCIENPKVSALRVGIEDAPMLNGRPASNPEIVGWTVETLEQKGVSIVRDAQEVSKITCMERSLPEQMLGTGLQQQSKKTATADAPQSSPAKKEHGSPTGDSSQIDGAMPFLPPSPLLDEYDISRLDNNHGLPGKIGGGFPGKSKGKITR